MSRFFGYLDPGTGSIVIQALIGVVAGVALFGRKSIGAVTTKIRSLFGKKNDEKK